MDESKAIEYLMHFGMSRQEATVYLRLIEAGKQTGYEIARDTGISRSNVYASLAALVEKGAAYLVEEDAKRYIPVHVQNSQNGRRTEVVGYESYGRTERRRRICYDRWSGTYFR